jgi:hypothetical protein
MDNAGTDDIEGAGDGVIRGRDSPARALIDTLEKQKKGT